MSSSVRFELGGGLHGAARVDQAVSRAAAIFESLFAADDAGAVTGIFWPSGGEIDDDRLLRVFVPEIASGRIERTAGVNYWGDPDGGPAYVRIGIACVPRRDLDYRTLFEMIARRELALQPAISARVEIVNETRPLVFVMYDDRGAIVDAPAAERLAVAAESHREWLIRDALRP